MAEYDQLRSVLAWLGANDAEDDDFVDAETVAQARALADLLEFAGAACPRVFWHGGDAVVFTFGPDEKMMLTISGDSVHVHYPRS